MFTLIVKQRSRKGMVISFKQYQTIFDILANSSLSFYHNPKTSYIYVIKSIITLDKKSISQLLNDLISIGSYQIVAMDQNFKDKLAALHQELNNEQMLDAYGPGFYQSLTSNDIFKFKHTIDQTNDQLALGLEDQIGSIIEFVQQLFVDSPFSKQLIISYWIFYLNIWAKRLSTEEENKLLKKINELVEEHKQLQDIFASVLKNWKLEPQQQAWLMQTAKESLIYGDIVEFLKVDDSPSEQKIRERHEDLLYIMRQMEKYHNIAEAQIHRHLLVQFELKYKLESPQRKKAEMELMDLKQIKDKLFSNIKPKINQAFSDLFRPSCTDRLFQLQIIKTELVNFDNFLFKRLIELSSQKFKDKDLNKNLILLVGPSGSGKTTIMLRLLGYELEATKFRGLKTLAPKNLRPEHKALHSSPQTNSITRYLFSQKIPKQFMPLGNDQIYYLCDTPGFQDSAGAEVDASNMISIIKAVAACRSIKLIVVVSQRKVGDRFDGIKKIAKIVSSMITNFKSVEKAQAIQFIFNKFDNPEDLKGLPAGISDILANLGPLQSANQSYKEFLTHFGKKMVKKNAAIIKFEPDIDVKQTMQSLDLEHMTDSTNNFKNSWSEDTKNAIKLRQTTLSKNIDKYTGKDNNKALYYLNELQVMSTCLDQDDQIRNSLLQRKKSIKQKAKSKYDTFCKILTEEIDKNDANNATYATIQKYSRQIGQYQIFFPIIDDLVTTAQITTKIDDVKKKQKEIIKNLACPTGEQQEVKKKVLSIFKFVEKISPNQVEDLFQMISSSLNEKRKNLKELIKAQNLKNVKISYDNINIILNILTALSNEACLKNGFESLKIDIQAERARMEQQILQCLNKFVTKTNVTLLKTKRGLQLAEQDTLMIKNILKQLQQVHFDPQSQRINSRQIIYSIKREIQTFIVQLIEKTIILFNTQDLSQSNMNQIKIYRHNINRIHKIYDEEYPIPHVEKLIKRLKQYINSSKQKLLDFIEKLKQEKAITKKNLKSFNKSYQVILKLGEDEELEKQICSLKQTVRKNLQRHIRQLEQKSSKAKISLKLKKSITHENINEMQKILYEAEAFNKTKQFKKPQYLSSKSDVLRSKFHMEGQQSSSDSEQQQLNIGQTSQKIFQDLIKKLLFPYEQISQQVKRMKTGGLGSLNSKFINQLQHFQSYKFYIQSKDIVFCRQFEEEKAKIEKQNSYKQVLTQILNEIKLKIESLSVSCKQQKFIDSENFAQISDLKRVIVFLLESSKHEQINELYLQCSFNIHQILDTFQKLIKDVFTTFGKELSEAKKKDKVTNIKRLKQLKQKIQTIKLYDNLYKDNSYTQTALSFETLISDTSKYIDKIQDMKASQVNNLFKDSEIVIKDIKQAYMLYATDDEKNQENIKQLKENLKEYGRKTLNNLIKERKSYLREDPNTIEGTFALQYITSLEKSYKLFEEISAFMNNQQFLSNFALKQQVFKDELKQIKIDQKLIYTLETVQQRIRNFDFKGKQKEFDKLIQTLRKVQNLQKKLSLSDQNYPYSDRLKEIKAKVDNQFSLKQTDNINIEDLISKDKFINLYIKLDKNSVEKKKIDTKIDQYMTKVFQQYHKCANKSEPQIAAFEDKIKNTVTNLPQNMRTLYRQLYKSQKMKFQEKTRAQLKSINKTFDGASLQNLRKLASKIKESNKEAVQKQSISVFEKNIKQIQKQILCFDNNKRLNLVKSLKKYYFYFGPQNSSVINQIVSNNKTKDIFESLEKQILTQFAQELKDLIRQLMQLMNKLYQQNSKQFDDKCQRINQFYALILENISKESNNSKFNVCINQWEKCLSLINEKLKGIMQESKEFSLKRNDYSARKLEKNLSDLKMIKVFQDSLAQSTLNSKIQENPESQKKSLLSKSLLKDKTQQFFIKILNREISDLINSIQKIAFFDDLIKVYNTANLQLEFENNIIKNLKMLKEIQELNKKYMFSQTLSKRNSQQLVKQTQQKWQIQLQQCLDEFAQSLYEEKLQISQKIGTFHRLAIIFQRKQWTVIDKNLKSNSKIQNSFKQNFEKIQNNLSNHFKFIENELGNKNSSNRAYTKKKAEISKQIQQWKQQLQSLRTQFNFKIGQAATEQTRQKLVLQLGNAQLLHKQKVDKIRMQLSKQNQLAIKKTQANLQNHVSTNIVQDLISMKKYSQSVTTRAKQSNSIIEGFITKICKYDKKINRYLYSALSSSPSPYALMIASQGLFFRAQAAEKFKNKTHKQDLGYVISNCPSLRQNRNLRESIERAFAFYQSQYNKNINSYKDSPRKQYIDTIVDSLRQYKSRSHSSRLQPAEVIAKIFSIWSITNADMTDPQNPQIDFQPHPAQIVSILLLIGFNDRISSKLIEVKTGQGKSIVLAGLCSYLALSGFKAYCACYSQYLSTRDEKLFKDLFDILEIRELISYGTFGEHCEAIINEIGSNSYQKSTFRDNIKQLIMETQPKNEQKLKEQFAKMLKSKDVNSINKVLIIDQADVFFNKNFFGQLYIPSITFQGPEVKEIIQKIWRMTQPSRQNVSIDRITKQQVIETEQFSKFLVKYGPIRELMQNQIIGMIEACYNYMHSYTIHQESLKYLQNDNITDKISYGYQTVFANCFQYQRKNICESAYNASLNISIKIGEFSYSQLPNFFRNILGVSGTLSSMSDFKLPLLKDKYGITDLYTIPSIYGDSKRTDDVYTLVQDDFLYDKIVQTVKRYSEYNRPTIIFFNSIPDIISFYKSPQFKELMDKATILSEETDHQSRDIIIKRVGYNGTITISTNSFSRGTDFQVLDEKIKEAGGLSVIETGIPADCSQFIQVRGRTARQGQKGSFQMIISEKQRQKFGIVCNDNRQFYDKMMDAWKKIQCNQCQALRQKVVQRKIRHDETISLLSTRFSRENIIDYIYKHNMYVASKANKVRTLIGIDGTSSMGPALQMVAKIVSQSFDRTKQVLDQKQIKGSFENQIAIYRNYNSDHTKLLQYSPFETESQRLQDFLKKIKIEGGYGNEAVQVLFQHASNISKLDQIILITDARANFPKQTTAKRTRNQTQDYWIRNGFPETDCQSQLLKLIQKKIKVHTLYINLDSSPKQKRQALKQYCESVSNNSSGNCSQLKINDKDAADFLTGFFVKNILLQIGGQEKGRELVQNYNLKYGAVPMRI